MNPRSDEEIAIVVKREEPAPGLSQAERLAVFGALNDKGRSARQIARVLCVDPRTITRWRRAARLTEES
ncbi:hypothetical protein SEA_LAZERLEMON_71 [Streptomyces phage LazerLemon]|nr:hypothetical protein SEA_LAZERLEMON_71 [Streptomyces phage LazerLemon]